MRHSIRVVLGGAFLGAAVGCGALTGVDWDRVAVRDGAEAGALDGALPIGADSASPVGAVDGGEDSPAGPSSDGSTPKTDGGVEGGVVPCSAPKVSCIQGCCVADEDPGLPTGIAAGDSNSCAVTTTGKVRCWGNNIVGQLGRGKGLDTLTPVTAYHIPSGATAVDIGGAHGCAVVAGFVGCWGANGSGQVGFDSTPANLGIEEPGRVKNIQGTKVTVSVGAQHSCALVDGTAYCWGSNTHGELAADSSVYGSNTPRTVAQLGSGVLAVGAHGVRSCAVIAGGSVMCWGGQVSELPYAITGISGASQIAVAPFHACALASGNVKCWGSNLAGELGDNSNGGNTPVSPTGLPAPVTAISANGAHTCAVVGGAAWCWGRNSSGQLGRNTGGSGGLPAAVPGISGVQAIATGDSHTCALVANGKIKCWGYNDQGQLGNGTKDGGFTPVDVTWP